MGNVTLPSLEPTSGELDRLRRQLASLAPDVSQETISHNRALIALLGQQANMRKLLHGVLNSPDCLAEIAGRSYRHINHFDKIVLIGSDDPSAYRLTLHLWRPPYGEREFQDELIHDHRFNFWSIILTGTLTSENFRFSDHGVSFRQYRYVPELRARSFSDFYEFCGETRLERAGGYTRTAGQCYFLQAQSIHRIALPMLSVTCSLVLRGPRLREYSTVFNTEYPRFNTHFSNSMFSTEELATRLTALLETFEIKRPAMREMPARERSGTYGD